MSPLKLVNLNHLKQLSIGSPDIKIGLIDGPVDDSHPDLNDANIIRISEGNKACCAIHQSIACTHGTAVAGILCSSRETPSTSICPNCSILVRPIFQEINASLSQMPKTTFEGLANAIEDCLQSGAHIINISAAPATPSIRHEKKLKEVLDYAVKKDVMVIAASGNQGSIGSTVITRHPWVIPVSACDLRGKPLNFSNFGGSIARNGLLAPGLSIRTLKSGGGNFTFSGTSAAAPFVTGTAALLKSIFPTAKSYEIKKAILQTGKIKRNQIVPPLLDAFKSYKLLRGDVTQTATMA